MLVRYTRAARTVGTDGRRPSFPGRIASTHHQDDSGKSRAMQRLVHGRVHDKASTRTTSMPLVYLRTQHPCTRSKHPGHPSHLGPELRRRLPLGLKLKRQLGDRNGMKRDVLTSAYLTDREGPNVRSIDLTVRSVVRAEDRSRWTPRSSLRVDRSASVTSSSRADSRCHSIPSCKIT